MSGRSASVGNTLSGGVQDVGALLPLIGTEQCEIHVGSALTGGYLYAAATPLSIFGSLGIVKAGISVLFSSISISIPKISISFAAFRPTFKYRNRSKWLGARVFADAGFKLSGAVSPLIGMDGQRFRAETRLLEILGEKHMDDPEKLSVDWKSRHWNTTLVIIIIFTAALSMIPYIALLLGPTSWRPSSIHLPWLFPFLRVVGSCTATITCQFIIQSRVISLMKNRIIFMFIDRRLTSINKDGFDAWLKNANVQWDSNLPSEECLWSLEKVLLSYRTPTKPPAILNNAKKDTDGEVDTPLATTGNSSPGSKNRGHSSIPVISLTTDSLTAPTADFIGSTVNDLHQLQREHFPTPLRNAVFITFSWIILGISLPAIVTGYIGCFTLVSATPSRGNGPLVWVGLEAALSIIRIFIWASNPRFDEETGISLGLRLSERQPMVVPDDSLTIGLDQQKRKALTLVPEREFLQRITPFTGPLDQFQKADNITLYFTLTSNSNRGLLADETYNADSVGRGLETQCLYVTVFDFNMRLGVTLVSSGTSFNYFDVTIKYNSISRQLEANIHSEKRGSHSWRIEDNSLFDPLERYYQYVINAFNQRDNGNLTAILLWKWDLTQKSRPTNGANNSPQDPMLSLLIAQNQSYLNLGYEYQLKIKLVATWCRWIVMDMGNIRRHTRLDCHEALRDATSEKGKWELAELDAQLAWGWVRRELVLLALSIELEDTLCAKMETCALEVNRVHGENVLELWMSAEFEEGRRRRMEHEGGEAKKRMEKAMKNASDQAMKEARPWEANSSLWIKSVEFIVKQWSAGINNQQEILSKAEDELKTMIWEGEQYLYKSAPYEQNRFVEQLRSRISHEHWRLQHDIEGRLMQATIERIRNLPAESTREEIDVAYGYPEPDTQATAKFVSLKESVFAVPKLMAKTCLGMVYDASIISNPEILRDTIAKSNTRSVINVSPKLFPSISSNDHLLFLSNFGYPTFKTNEPDFVRQNRARWWDQQTTNASTFYFTPTHVYGDDVDGNSCISVGQQSIAHIFVFLTAISSIRVGVLHHGVKDNAMTVSIQKNKEELGTILNVPSTFQLDHFDPFVLQQGRHELELVPQKTSPGRYYLRDILIELSVFDESTFNPKPH